MRGGGINEGGLKGKLLFSLNEHAGFSKWKNAEQMATQQSRCGWHMLMSEALARSD